MKKVFGFVVVMISVLMLAACHIEDTNGDADFTIETFTDEDILKGVNSTSYTNSLESNFGKDYSLTAKFSGIDNIYEFSYDKSSKITVVSKVTSGNFRMVLVSNDVIVKDIPFNQTYVLTDLNVDQWYSIYIVGESAKIEIDIDME